MFAAGKVKDLNLRSPLGGMWRFLKKCNLTVPKWSKCITNILAQSAKETAFFRNSKFSKAKPLQGRRLNLKNIKTVSVGAMHLRKCEVFVTIRYILSSFLDA